MKRRQFLRQSSCAAIGSSTLLSSLLNMRAVSAAAMSNSTVYQGSDYKALVCIFLAGGNDSFNMLVPNQGSAYSEYARSRSNNAIPSDQLIPINVQNGDGRSFGLHPSMPNLASMFDRGRAAFVCNIGTLVEPATVTQFYQNSVRLPLGLYSHSDQTQQWQTAIPQERVSNGWVGRMTELMLDMQSNQSLSINVSLEGTNFLQTGANSVPYTMVPGEGPRGILEFGSMYENRQLRDRAVKSLLEQQYSDAFEKTYINTLSQSLDAFDLYSDAFEQVGGVLSAFEFGDDNWGFSRSMQTVADTIVARDILNQQRQTFFVQFSDWDHHDELVMSHATQLEVLDRGLKTFYDAMDSQGLGGQVTTFLISEFGRPLTSNGNGTDHAWGGNVFVVGDAVQGQQMFGSYPNLSLGDERDLGGGIFVPALSADEYFAELALWFGASPSDLHTILPNLGNFYDVSSDQMPIGFIKAG